LKKFYVKKLKMLVCLSGVCCNLIENSF